jgi:hypothetical protein
MKPKPTKRLKSNFKQGSLKNLLFSRRISNEQFLEMLMKLDQSTSSRKDALQNAELLRDRQIKKILTSSSLARKYYRTLSLTYFHIGQLQAKQNNTKSALYNFKRAGTSVEKFRSKALSDWKLYIKATIAYIAEDRKRLQMFYARMPDSDKNKPIIKNFISGLARGRCNYLKDYSKKRY